MGQQWFNGQLVPPGPFNEHVYGLVEGAKTRWLKKQKTLNELRRLSKSETGEMAHVLVGLAEDIHCGIGLWAAYERINRRLFGTPLPMTLSPWDATSGEPGFHDRLSHLIYVMYPVLRPDCPVRPNHRDLIALAREMADFFGKYLPRTPTISGLKILLQEPNPLAWDIKRKLVAIGMSPLFKHVTETIETEEVDGEPKDVLDIVDDLACEETSIWSGMGAVELLAEQQDLSPERRADLLAWTERHFSIYRLDSKHGECIDTTNLINNKPYRMRCPGETPLRPNMYIYGAVVPWNGDWWWTGMQREPNGTAKPEKMVRDYLAWRHADAYRYCPDRVALGRKVQSGYHESFVKRHGTDFVVFNNGAQVQADLKSITTIRPEILAHKNGIGVFSSPQRGTELVLHFDSVASALKKKGKGLEEAELNELRNLVGNSKISPEFVKRVAAEFGAEAILEVCAAGGVRDEYALDYLLRRHKGKYYRKTYPTVRLV